MIKDIFTKKENQIMLGVVLISVILILFGFYLLNKEVNNSTPRKIPNSIEEIKWEKYTDSKYEFSLEYPDHFNFEKNYKSEFGPVFNFYFDKGKNDLPFDNYVNQNHFSIYPEGVVSRNSDHLEYFTLSEYTNDQGVEFDLREYETIDGEIWAIMAIPKNSPKSWVDFGFIWISSKISDKDVVCYEGGVSKEIDFCNPLEGDQFYMKGNVDTKFIETSREILNKFNFETK